MRKPWLVPVLRGPVRLFVTALALVIGLSRSAGSSTPNNPNTGPDIFAVPANALLPQFGCDGGDGGDGGGDWGDCSGCNYFCGCDCYYGFVGGGCW
jgi:hypothetical protein